MSKPAARIGDMHVCPMVTGLVPHVGGPIAMGMPTVLIGGMPSARVGDMAVCVGPPDVIAMGAFTTLVGGKPAARMGDMTAHGGNIVIGFPMCLIGDGGGAGGGGGGGGAGAAKGGGKGGATLNKPYNGPFDTQDEAAKAALDSANPRSIAENREYGGVIYRDTDGKYYFTGPGAGSETGFNPSTTPAPSGTTVVGDYHTHGDYSIQDSSGNIVRTSDPARDSFNSDSFSATDYAGIANDGAGVPGYTGYLGTPSGEYYRHNPATDYDAAGNPIQVPFGHD